jgi:hypothetical protein
MALLMPLLLAAATLGFLFLRWLAAPPRRVARTHSPALPHSRALTPRLLAARAAS